MTQLSFKYCRKCAEKYYTNPIFQTYDKIHFFIPSHDIHKQPYIVLMEMKITTLQTLHKKNRIDKKHEIIDLSQMATILHTEKGFFNNYLRLQAIHHYYKNLYLLATSSRELIA